MLRDPSLEPSPSAAPSVTEPARSPTPAHHTQMYRRVTSHTEYRPRHPWARDSAHQHFVLGPAPNVLTATEGERLKSASPS